MAENDGSLHDQDGDSPDWIEVFNDSLAPVNMFGWHLTDTPTNLTKWTFPATELPSGGFLIVFASGKNRAVAGAELHTDFQLQNNGGFLALVQPDGTTITTAFTNYPTQHRNVSFGTGVSNAPASTLLTTNSTARWLVPTNDALGTTWTATGFDVSSWSTATTPLRYDVTLDGGALRIDFNARSANTEAATQVGFNSFVINGASGAQSAPTTRTFGGVNVTISASATGITYDDRVRTSPSNGGALTTQNIYRDFIFSPFSTSNGGTNGLDVLVTGLKAGSNYIGKVWCFDASSATGNRISDWFVNGVLVTNNYSYIGSTLPANDNANTISFTATASNTGGILIAGRRDTTSLASQPSIMINALQLLPVIPLPATNGNVAALAGQNPGLYARQSFVVADPSAFNQLILRVRYDDGFVAYLNGTEVARRHAPVSPTWNSTATITNSAGASEDLILPGATSLLVTGANVLAVQALNISAGDSDFFFEPQLVATFASVTAGSYLAVPTPGALNTQGYLGVVADTKFSVDRGFYDAPFSLSITSATAGAEIHYTLNGSEPSLTNGFTLTSPIMIAGQSFVRAAAFLPGWIPSGVDTHSYIFLSDVLRQSNNIPGYPTNWQANYLADYGMDSNIVNHPVYGATISNDLRSIATLSIVAEQNGLWNVTTGIYPNPTSIGPAWERAASIELIRGDSHTEFATTAKIQIHGNASRDNVRTPKHSIGVSFNSDYGPTKLQYDWFGGGVDVHDGIVLRSCGFVDGWAGRYADSGTYTSAETGETFRGLRYRPENTCYLRDVWMKDSFRAMGWVASRSQFVHLYINGLYWGLYEPSEHYGASYFKLHLGGLESAWDVVVGEDNNGPPVLVDGSLSDWQNVLNLVNAGITTESAYAAITNLVDIDNLIDYMMLHTFAESEDWPRHNWYVAHRRATNGAPGTKFICAVWDQELTLDRLVRDTTRNRINTGSSGGEVYSPARVYSQLRAWPEFRRQFGDRVHKHLFNGGALTPSNNVARLLAPAAIIHDALVGESARWGDARKTAVPAGQLPTGVTFTRDEWWQPEIDKLATNFFLRLTADNVTRFRTNNLYPLLAAPDFNQFGGAVSNGFSLVITHTNASGTIYFTTDGTDPREYGTGAVGPAAQSFSVPVPINTPTLIRTRVLDGTTWSALVEAMFYPPQDLSKLALTEIMYNPPALGATNGDEFEFLELKNFGTSTLNLSGLTFTSGINFTFTNGTLLEPGQFFVLVRNAAAFALKYPGVAVNGVYTGKLDNGGESLTLSHALGGHIFSVSYDDVTPWPLTADNFGFSIVPKNPGFSQAPDNGASWRASSQPGGSPGADDPASTILPVLINEVLTASTPPDVDTIELFNPNDAAVNIGGWFLTDDPGTPKKFRIPDNTSLAAGGFAVFTEAQFNATPGTNNSFSLNSHGDDVYLFSGDATTNLTGYSHGFTFSGSASNVTFGRYVNSVGEEQFPAQSASTFMATNSGPSVGPVVINEIHYHPAAAGDEFIELKNISAQAIAFFDPAHPTNTWSLTGLNFYFPTDVTLDPNALLLLVSTNPTDFRAKYSVPTNVIILGPFAGALQDSGERLELKRPGTPDTNGVPHITVDEVRYNDKAPWSPAADGSGASLQRINATAYGNDPINWQAAIPTPGQPNSNADSDGDGLPDSWEIAHGTSVNIPDADADPDGDGATNREEYLAGTDPQVAESYLKLDQVNVGAGFITLQFTAVSNHTYSVLFKDALEPGPWTKLTDVLAQATNRVETVTDANPSTTNRFYRLRTPQIP